MDPAQVLTFRHWHHALDGKAALFDSVYVEQYWLPLIGSLQLALLRLAGRGVKHDREFQLTFEELSGRMGVAVRAGNQSPVLRAIRRLERFSLLRAEDPDSYGR